MNDCIFCKIVSGDIPNYTVYQDEKVLAFLDVKPHALGHTVVIPKEHSVLTAKLSEGSYNTLMKSLRKVMNKLYLKLKPDGFNVGWNEGSAAGQVVPHAHIHVMPRWNGDGGGSQHSIISNPGKLSVAQVAELLK